MHCSVRYHRHLSFFYHHSQAIEHGADVIIVGRGVTHAKDPAQAASDYRVEGWRALSSAVGQ